jgi:hypothetical protein
MKQSLRVIVYKHEGKAEGAIPAKTGPGA